MSTLDVEQVFNSRGEYNERMYIKRPEHERQFKNALKSDMCVIVHGQSGTGKTWLTRRVLMEENYYFKPINLAHASTAKSIYLCFKNVMSRDGWHIRTKFSEMKRANLKIPIADGGFSNTTEYSTEVDFFMEFLKYMQNRARNKDKKRYIVFENFESIIDNEQLIKELTNLITLVDDDEVLKYKTKFIIVGATRDIQKYFSKVTNVNTIENRVTELPEIRSLTTKQSFELVEKGFDLLDIAFEEHTLKETYQKRIAWLTGGIPQRLHEFCYELSIICKENNWQAKGEYIDRAVKYWITTSLNKNYVCISKVMAKEKTKISKKNQMLFCLGLIQKESFDHDEIREEMDHEFPNSKTPMGTVIKILEELCRENPPILVKNHEMKDYSFADTKYALCLRSMLYKAENEYVAKYDYEDL